MAWTSLGQVTVTTPGTRVQLTINQSNPAARVGCQSLLVQAISSALHTNTGRVYLYYGATGGAPLATLAVPTANTIPSAAATVPDAPGALDASGYYIDADNATDGVNASYLRP
jgi:hypothetical protein